MSSRAFRLPLVAKKDQPKEHVQHRISKFRPEVWALLKDEQCHYYVCGDSNMAEDVYDELFQTTKELGNMNHRDAWAFFDKMKKEHRFQTDTWGVVNNLEAGSPHRRKRSTTRKLTG